MRWLLITCGFFSLLIGFIGVVIPLLPTTPFVLLAAACFARSSERFHNWLVQHPRFGPALNDWRASGVIRLPAKLLATGLMLVGLSFPVFIIDVPAWASWTALAVAAPVLLFIWTRPSRPRARPDLHDPASEVSS